MLVLIVYFYENGAHWLMLAPQSKRTQLDSENVQSVELFITIELCIIELSQFRYTVLLFVFPPFAGKFVWCIFTGEWNTMANTKRRNPNANWTNIQFFLLICFFSPFKIGKHISTPTFPIRCIRFSMPSQFSNFFTIFFLAKHENSNGIISKTQTNKTDTEMSKTSK